jgi:hypothetical protein
MPALLTRPARASDPRIAFDLRRSGDNRLAVGHVEQQRPEQMAEFRRKPLRVLGFPDRAEHLTAVGDQHFDASPADAGRRAGDDDRSHLRKFLSTERHVDAKWTIANRIVLVNTGIRAPSDLSQVARDFEEARSPARRADCRCLRSEKTIRRQSAAGHRVETN